MRSMKKSFGWVGVFFTVVVGSWCGCSLVMGADNENEHKKSVGQLSVVDQARIQKLLRMAADYRRELNYEMSIQILDALLLIDPGNIAAEEMIIMMEDSIGGRPAPPWILKERAENHVSWIDETQNPPAGVVEKLPRLKPLLNDDGQSIKTPKAWRKRRIELFQAWQAFLGPMPFNPNKPKLKVLDEEVFLTEPYRVIRQLVEYEGEPGMKVQGYLLKPHPMPKSCPGVVVMHSTVNHTIRQPAGVEGVPEKAFAFELAKKGVAAFCPECFLWVDKGERSYRQQAERFVKRFPKSKGMSKMLFDASRAVDVLESVEDVDAKRIGAIGHSLGAKEALYLAAFDPRVKVAVSSEGGIGKHFSNWDAPWYLGSEFKDFEHDHHELLALIAPRPFLLVGGDSADGTKSWPYILEARKVYELYNRPKHLGLLDHGKGHSVPPGTMKRMIEWLMHHL